MYWPLNIFAAVCQQTKKLREVISHRLREVIYAMHSSGLTRNWQGGVCFSVFTQSLATTVTFNPFWPSPEIGDRVRAVFNLICCHVPNIFFNITSLVFMFVFVQHVPIRHQFFVFNKWISHQFAICVWQEIVSWWHMYLFFRWLSSDRFVHMTPVLH